MGKALNIDWDSQPLGKISDKKLAKRLNVGYTSVWVARKERNIPSFTETKRMSHLGKTYNRLTILEIFIKEKGIPKQQNCAWAIAKCCCGNIKEYNLHAILNGSSKSCGCLNKEYIRIAAIKRRRPLKISGRNNV